MAVQMSVKIKVNGENDADKAFNDAKKSANALHGAVTALSTGYLALADIIGKVAGMVSAPIKAAIEAEAAANRLVNSLKVAEQYTMANAVAMSVYSDQMEQAANIDGELIDKLNATNVMMLRNTEQAQNLTSASIALSKAFGTDVNSANQLLVASLQGQDRQLKKLIPEVGSLTDAQLRAGEAVNIVNDKFSSFITGDIATTEGVLGRISKALDKLTEDMGRAFLEGVKQSGFWDSLRFKLGMVTDAAGNQADEWQNLGKTVGTLADKYLDGLIDGLDMLVKSANAVAWVFEKIQNIIEVFVGLVLVAVNSVRAFVGEIQALAAAGNRPLFTLKGGFKLTEFKEYADAYEKFNAVREENEKAADENVSNMVKNIKELFGVIEANREKSVIAPPETKAPSTTKFRNTMTGTDSSIVDQTIDLQKQIAAETQAIAMSTSNTLVAEIASRMQKIADLERDAARNGINVTREAEQLKLLIVEDFGRKIVDQRIDDQLEMAKASGKTIDAIELQYQKEVEAYRKMRAQDRITEQEFTDAVVEMRRRADEQSIKTTGDAAYDEALEKGNQFVGAVKGGISGIITMIGSMFGPIGTLIAGIINFLNQPPAQFKQMIDGIIQGIRNLPEFIGQAIMILIESWPSILEAFYSKIMSPAFWSKMIKGLFQAIVNMFKNFWSYIFGGEMESQFDEVAAQAQTKKVQFGSDQQEQAGEEQFKIKDQELAGQRRVTESFEQSFEETVDNSTKGFLYYLSEAWDNIIAKLKEFFTNLWQAFLQVFRDIGEIVATWGQKIWDALNKAAEAIKEWGGRIWEGFKEKVGEFWEWIKSIGTRIWAGLLEGLNTIWDTLKEMGKAIYNGFASMLGTLWETFKGFGKMIIEGFKDAIGGIWEWLKDIGKRIWEGIAEGLGTIGNIGGGGGIKIGGTAGQITETIKGWFNEGGMVPSSYSNPSLAKAFAAAGALKFAEGGMVPGSGFSDSVPAVLTPGEFVMNREQVASANKTSGGLAVNFTFHVSAGANLDREAIKRMMPQVIEEVRRAGRNGTQITSPNGVYK